MTIIYWFRRDRRLSDNPALAMAIKLANETNRTLLPVTLRQTNPDTQWDFARLGPHRLAFEAQSLIGLSRSLQTLNSTLYEPALPGIAGLIALAHEVKASSIVCEEIHAPHELDEIDALQSAGLNVQCLEQAALLPHDTLPFEVSKTPIVFSDFRRQVEKAKLLPRTPLLAPTSLPPLPPLPSLPAALSAALAATNQEGTPELDPRSAFPYQHAPWFGNEASAQAHLAQYFKSTLPRHYKETRNGLIGTDYSTKFSPWLAVGAVSAAQIRQALTSHETQYGANDSTYWIWFELLWRDHFRLMMRRFGRELFLPRGLSKSAPSEKKHNAQGFVRWCTANTGNAFIDAAMRELNTTGYLSNRMRQNVASFLIHDLGGDWRAGAAWFEHCLVDFDVHSNQGNWAYIAGVGTDPRGGRRFNPDKQAHDYDRDRHYRELWSTS